MGLFKNAMTENMVPICPLCNKEASDKNWENGIIDTPKGTFIVHKDCVEIHNAQVKLGLI
jgi:hypothetical protein